MIESKGNEDAIVFLAIAVPGLKDPNFDPEICHMTFINQAG